MSEMADESPLAIMEISIGIQNTITQTDVKVTSFKFGLDKAVKELD